VFVDGKECCRRLTKLDQESKKVGRYELNIYSCSLGHRSGFIEESKLSKESNSWAQVAYSKDEAGIQIQAFCRFAVSKDIFLTRKSSNFVEHRKRQVHGLHRTTRLFQEYAYRVSPTYF
jgi:hypothetical protein